MIASKPSNGLACLDSTTGAFLTSGALTGSTLTGSGVLIGSSTLTGSTSETVWEVAGSVTTGLITSVVVSVELFVVDIC